jgi:hypothetical protein
MEKQLCHDNVSWLFSGLLNRVVWYDGLTDVSEVLAASLIWAIRVNTALMMEAANTSETSVNLHQITSSNKPEDRHLHTLRREDLNSHRV